MGASGSRNRRRGGQGAYVDPVGPPPLYQNQTAPLSFYPGQPGQPQYHPQAYSQTAHLPPGIGPHAHPPAGPRAPPSYYPANHAPAPVKNSVHNTSTVRNLVNLKKSTLAVASLEDRPHLKQVSFKFDATAPCYVSVLPMAQEEGREGRLTTKAKLGPRVQYDKGWNLTFPPEGLVDPELYCIDTSVYGGEQLHHANVATHAYPLIIRIETLGEAAGGAAPSGADVASMPLGCAQPEWLQSQTTYAVLGEDAGGQVAKVVKQKIWVNGASYELQEIYGLMEASTGTGDGDTSTECVVCLTNPKNTTVIPCRHFCMCSDCAKALLNQSRKCPMCRLNITSVLQINIGASSRAAPGAKGAVEAGSKAGTLPVLPAGVKAAPLV